MRFVYTFRLSQTTAVALPRFDSLGVSLSVCPGWRSREGTSSTVLALGRRFSGAAGGTTGQANCIRCGLYRLLRRLVGYGATDLVGAPSDRRRCAAAGAATPSPVRAELVAAGRAERRRPRLSRPASAFQWRVAGDAALVGARDKTVNGKSWAGAVYIFTRSGTKLVTTGRV